VKSPWISVNCADGRPSPVLHSVQLESGNAFDQYDETVLFGCAVHFAQDRGRPVVHHYFCSVKRLTSAHRAHRNVLQYQSVINGENFRVLPRTL